MAFFTYWGICHFHPPPVHFSRKEWKEPKDYIREEERTAVLEGESLPDTRSDTIDGEDKLVGEVAVQAMEKRV